MIHRTYLEKVMRFSIGKLDMEYLKMFNNILIIGCGMIGSSILRGIISQKLCKKAYVHEKNIKYQNQIKTRKIMTETFAVSSNDSLLMHGHYPKLPSNN